MRSDIHLIDLNPRDSVTAGAPPLAAQCVSVTALEPARSIGAMVWASWGSLYFLADDLGTSGRDFVGRATSLYRLDIATGAVRRLTDSGFDLGEVGSDLSFDGDGVLVQVRERGRVRIARVSDAGEFTPLEPADVVATGQHAGGGRVVAVVFHSTSAGEGPHPVLLNVHGGPFAAYTVAVVDEFQVYADARYAVVFCNPRGAAGYGEDHARAIRRAMGTVDFDDVIDFLEGVVAEHPQLDGSRLGIMGGSYGGYLTAWITAHDHRFAAAVVEHGFLDPI